MVLTSLLRIRTLSRAPMSGPTALWPHAWFHMESIVCDWPWALESSWRAGQNFPNQNKLLFNNNLENMWLSRYLSSHTHTRPQEKLRLQGLGTEDVLKYKRNTLAVVAGLVWSGLVLVQHVPLHGPPQSWIRFYIGPWFPIWGLPVRFVQLLYFRSCHAGTHPREPKIQHEQGHLHGFNSRCICGR